MSEYDRWFAVFLTALHALLKDEVSATRAVELAESVAYEARDAIEHALDAIPPGEDYH